MTGERKVDCCCFSVAHLSPWTAARQASLSFTISQSLLKLMSIESMMPSNHLILCGYYNYVEWKSLWDKQNEAPQSYVKLLFIHKWCCVYSGIGRGFSIISSFWKTKWLILTSTCSQLDKLKAALDEKHLELVKRKCKILHQDNSRPCFFDDQAKTVTAWLGSSDSSTTVTRHCTFRFSLILVFTKFS